MIKGLTITPPILGRITIVKDNKKNGNSAQSARAINRQAH